MRNFDNIDKFFILIIGVYFITLAFLVLFLIVKLFIKIFRKKKKLEPVKEVVVVQNKVPKEPKKKAIIPKEKIPKKKQTLKPIFNFKTVIQKLFMKEVPKEEINKKVEKPIKLAPVIIEKKEKISLDDTIHVNTKKYDMDSMYKTSDLEKVIELIDKGPIKKNDLEDVIKSIDNDIREERSSKETDNIKTSTKNINKTQNKNNTNNKTQNKKSNNQNKKNTSISQNKKKSNNSKKSNHKTQHKKNNTKKKSSKNKKRKTVKKKKA